MTDKQTSYRQTNQKQRLNDGTILRKKNKKSKKKRNWKKKHILFDFSAES